MKRVARTSIWLLVVALLAAGLSALSHFKFWWAFLIAACAILVNGWFATLEDDLPGGLNNPDGRHTPRYMVAVTWVVRTLEVLIGILILGLVVLYFFSSLHAS